MTAPFTREPFLSLRDIFPHRGESPYSREPFLSLQKVGITKAKQKTPQFKKQKPQKNRAPTKVPCKSVFLTLFIVFLLFSQCSLLPFRRTLAVFSTLFSLGRRFRRNVKAHFTALHRHFSKPIGISQSFETSSFKYALKSSLSSG